MKKIPFFYGYNVVGAAVGIMIISWGSNRTFGVFLDPMLSDFSWTRAEIAGPFTLGNIMLGCGSILAGRLTDRMGPRAVAIACGLLLGVGYIGTSQIQSLWQFYFFYGLCSGLGMSGAWVPLMSMVTRWFVKRRALMSGIVAAGPSMGIMIMPLVVSLFISAWGWRWSYGILGGIVLSVILLAAPFLRKDPAAMGLLPYGAEESQGQGKDFQGRGYSWEEAWRTRQFWLLALISFSDLFLINVIVVHLVPHALQLQIPAITAASIFSLGAGVAIPGRILIGWMADRISNRRTLFICLALSIVSFAVLLWARGLWAFYIFSLIYGVSLWSTGAIMSPLTADIFGLKAHGSIFSGTVFGGMIGGAVGPVLVGYTYDVTGTYQAGFFICFFVSLIALLGITLLRPLGWDSIRACK